MTRLHILTVAMLCVGATTARAQDASTSTIPLDAMVQAGLAHNPTLRAAAAGVQAAAAATSAARASLFPRVTVTESWQRGDQPVFVFSALLASRRFAASNFAIDQLTHPGALGYFHGTAAVEQLLFDGGARKARIDAALATQQIAGTASREAALGVAATIADTYGRLLAVQAAHRTTSSIREASQADLELAIRRRDAGMVTEADVLSLRVHVADLEQRIIQAEGDAEVLRAQLNRLTGEPVTRTFVAVEPSPRAGTSLPALDVLLTEARANRPELQRAAASEAFADSGRRAARAAFAPTIAAQAAYDVSGTRVSGRAASWLVGGEIRWTLALAGAERAQLIAATAAASRARAEADDARAQAEVEVVTALQHVTTARARQAAGVAAMAQARESQRIIRDRFDAGLAPLTDLLRAASAVLDADARRVGALVDLVTGTARLNLALGRVQ